MDIILDVTGSLTAAIPLGLPETFTFPAVPEGTDTMRVRAANASGVSPWSNAVTLSFPGACFAAPRMPANFLAYNIGSRIVVLWDPPQSGEAPTQYVLHVDGPFAGSVATSGRSLSGAVGQARIP